MLGLTQLYVTAMWTYTKSHYLTVAADRVQNEVEKVRNLGFYPLENGPGAEAYLPTSMGGEYTYLPRVGSESGVSFPVKEIPNGRGTVKWSPFPSYALNELKVTVQVTWDNGKQSGPSDVTVTTLVVNR
jgi:hypothetical protein